MNLNRDLERAYSEHCDCRRALLRAAAGFAVSTAVGASLFALPARSNSAALNQRTRDAMTPDQVIESLKTGNERFRTGKMSPHDYLAQKRATVSGQHPGAVILSCIDSRAPAEIILDARIGDLFNARVAGNVSNDDVLGSLEFGCALSGAKVVVVMGHTACGAIKGAIDGAQLGNLTGLLDKIKPAIDATYYEGDRTSKNPEFVDEVTKTNVLSTIRSIRDRSTVLAGLEKDGKIKIVGSMYQLVGGRVEFFT